jgi:hypothetical protein
LACSRRSFSLLPSARSIWRTNLTLLFSTIYGGPSISNPVWTLVMY